jgi:hypothetical protein
VVIPPAAALPPVGLGPAPRTDPIAWRQWTRDAWDAVLDAIDRARPALGRAGAKVGPAVAKMRPAVARLRPVGAALGRAGAWGRDAFTRTLALAVAWVEQHRSRLPAPLAKISARAYVGAAGFVLVATAVVIGVLLASGSSATAARGRAAARAPSSAQDWAAASASAASLADELGRARASGTAALEALLAQHPNSAGVLLELSRAYLLEKRHPDAVSAAQRALSRDPTYNQNTDLARILWHLAQPPDSSDAAFTLLEGPMGSKGADIVYDLAVTPGVRKEVKQRAEDFFKSPRFVEQASAALKVAVALRAAPACEKARALLPDAQSSGDERALKLLRRYESAVGCGRRGKQDCYPCMRQDSRLRDSIRAIEQRSRPATDVK